MATVAQRVVVTCDRVVSRRPCGRPAKTYTLTGPDDTWTIDLCDPHADSIYGVAVREGRLVKRHTGQRATAAQLKRPFIENRGLED